MIEWDAHTNKLPGGLDRLVAFDKLIRKIAQRVDPRETLLLFTGDHSFDLRVHGGRRGQPLLDGLDDWQRSNVGKSPAYTQLSNVRVFNTHTGEEVIVAAMGPGSERVSGFMPNTRLFEIMLAAWGWPEDGVHAAGKQRRK
jgi:alkaline phosphatase